MADCVIKHVGIRPWREWPTTTNLCNGGRDGLFVESHIHATCDKCLKILLNDALMKIDGLEDDLMVANRTISVLSQND